MSFSREKNGYDVKQVDSFIKNLRADYEQSLSEQKIRISDLKRELESVKTELASFRQKNSDISSALVVAVETAKQIEASSKNVYELEIKRIKNLYNKWESLFENIAKQYPEINNKYDTKLFLDKLNSQINKVITENGISLDEVKEEPVGIRNLISKMGGLTSKPLERTIIIKKPESRKETDNPQPQPKVDLQKTESPQLRIKPIANMTKDKQEKFDNLIDKFFDSPAEEDNAYSRALIREKKSNGFDLKEALNPTEDLAEIMKDFDFFDDDDKK